MKRNLRLRHISADENKYLELTLFDFVLPGQVFGIRDIGGEINSRNHLSRKLISAVQRLIT